jgi:uncharacterized membrane protein
MAALAVVGRCAFGVFLMNSGVQHFLFTGAVLALIPAWIPGPRVWAYATGVALIAGGAGLIAAAASAIRVHGLLSLAQMLLRFAPDLGIRMARDDVAQRPHRALVRQPVQRVQCVIAYRAIGIVEHGALDDRLRAVE